MRKHLIVISFLMLPLVAWADPISIDGQSSIAYSIVAFWALLIESGIVTLTLVSTGIVIVPSFIALALANIAVFVFGFLPLAGHMSLWTLEPGVVLADAVAIKVLVATPFLQGGDFVGVTWRRALVASLIGNAASFFVGVIGSHEPWIDHSF
jgi:hypothetical protein